MHQQMLSAGMLAAGIALAGGSLCAGSDAHSTGRSSDAGSVEGTEQAGDSTSGAVGEFDVDARPPGILGRLLARSHGDATGGAPRDAGPDPDAGETRSRDVADLSVAELETRAREREIDGTYRWHDDPRRVDDELECPDVETVEYGGTIVTYEPTVEVNREFRDRLRRFEQIVRDVAVEVYGRPPDRILQMQSYDCKTIRDEGEELSEHSFGHAIDVGGFEFDAVSEERRDELGRAGEAFTVRVADHWDARGGFAVRHRRFLHRLVEQLQWRGPFSTILGPGYPNHDAYFHFDFGPEFFFRP